MVNMLVMNMEKILKDLYALIVSKVDERYVLYYWTSTRFLRWKWPENGFVRDSKETRGIFRVSRHSSTLDLAHPHDPEH
jgi:hypothetical protein